MTIDELEKEPKSEPQTVPQERSLVRYPNGHPSGHFEVVSRVVAPANKSGYPRISPLEAELMELMGDSLGG